MRNKIPPDAFEYYVGLGTGRSYALVAKHYGVTLRGVTKRAVKEHWREQLDRITEQARRKTEARTVEDLASIDERHLRTVRAVQARGLETLKTMPMNSPAAAVRAIDVAIKLERAILGRSDGPDAPGTHAQLVEAASMFTEDEMNAAKAAIDAVRAKKKAVDPPHAPPPLMRGGLLSPGEN